MSPLDIGLCLFLIVAWPVYEKWIDWPRFQRWLDRVPSRARIREFQVTIVQQWLLTAIAAFIWLHAGRSWESIGMRPLWGWRLWGTAVLALALIALNMYQVLTIERSEKARRAARNSQSIKSVEMILPHGDTELRWFFLVSMTAGFCEEFLFRGYLIHALAPLLTWWGAAALALIPFGLLHGYQGRAGIIKTAIVGAFMTLTVAATRSLIPAMIFHALIDIGGGVVAYTIIRPRRSEAVAEA
jgi:membrane protease YdiL (CAAX protease family)